LILILASRQGYPSFGLLPQDQEQQPCHHDQQQNHKPAILGYLFSLHQGPQNRVCWPFDFSSFILWLRMISVLAAASCWPFGVLFPELVVDEVILGQDAIELSSL